MLNKLDAGRTIVAVALVVGSVAIVALMPNGNIPPVIAGALAAVLTAVAAMVRPPLKDKKESDQ